MVECAKCDRKIGFFEEKFNYESDGKSVKYCKECNKAYVEKEEKERKKKTLSKIPQSILKSFFKNFAGFGAEARMIPGLGINFAFFNSILESKTKHTELWEALQDNSMTRCIHIVKHTKAIISNSMDECDEQSERHQQGAGLFMRYGALLYDFSLIPGLQEKLKKSGINMSLLELVEVLAEYESKHSKLSDKGEK